jgi:hypothetical protein
MALARRSQALAGGGDGAGDLEASMVWESEEVLAPLYERLVSGDRYQAEASAALAVTIGEAAVPALVNVLAGSENISARKRAIEALVGMEASPAAQLAPLLTHEHPWYLQRNAVHVLRRRRDAGGLQAAKALWPQADPRVRLETLRYLVELEDGERLAFVRAGVADRSPEVAMAAARVAAQAGDAEAVTALIQRAEGVPPLEVGAPFHLDLLRLLARAGDPRGRAYVEGLAARRRPLLPWLRDRFRRDLDELLREKR